MFSRQPAKMVHLSAGGVPLKLVLCVHVSLDPVPSHLVVGNLPSFGRRGVVETCVHVSLGTCAVKMCHL